MKRLTLSLLAIALLATSSLAEAQDRPAPKKAAASSVGLIDMAYVFQNYDKFKELRDGLQAAVQESDAEAKKRVEELQNLQKSLAEKAKQFDAGSPQYEDAERQILDGKANLDSWRQATQRSLARKETEMLKVIYSDVNKMVKLYAEYAQYSLILRFNRKGVEDDMQPQQAIQAMNKNVIYHQTGNDITEIVLKQLNNQYKKSGGTRARSAGQGRPVK